MIFLRYSPASYLPDGEPVAFDERTDQLIRSVAARYGVLAEIGVMFAEVPRKKDLPEALGAVVEDYLVSGESIVLCGADASKAFLGKGWAKYEGTGVQIGKAKLYPITDPSGIVNGAAPGNLYLAVRKASEGIVCHEQ